MKQEFSSPKMRLLIAEDESDISHTYRLALESRDHEVVIANNGIRCLEIYHEELRKRKEANLKDKKNGIKNNNLAKPNSADEGENNDAEYGNKAKRSNLSNVEPSTTTSYNAAHRGTSPFDAVVLDYKMPGKDGMEVAKEILDLNPDQRIIFASAYVEETLADSVKKLRRVVELLQKPFEMQAFIDTIEDNEVYDELKKIFVNIREADRDDDGSLAQDSSSDPPVSREQIRDMFECLRKIQKNRTF